MALKDEQVIITNLWNAFNPSNAKGTFRQKHKNAMIFEKRLNPVMLVFIR